MKIYTIYSESHKLFYTNYFKPSLRKLYSKEELPIKVCEVVDIHGSDEYMSPEWVKSVQVKVDMLIDALEENKGGWFIYADCDIQFLKPFVEDIKEELQGYDLVGQQDDLDICTGFFAIKSNEKTLHLFRTIKKHFWSFRNDQVAFNVFKNSISYKSLDKEKYYTIGNFFNNLDGTHEWDGVTNIIPPKNILVHHANFVRGVHRKIKLFDLIKSNYESLYTEHN